MKRPYPWLALGLGLSLGLILFRFGALNPEGENSLPLLTLLLVAEFGFLVTCVAAGIGVRDLIRQGARLATIIVLCGNLVLAVGFLRVGLALWPGTSGG